MDRHGLLVAVLWLIALYHLAMGIGGLVSDRMAERLARDVFGLKLRLTPQSSYLVRLLGIYTAVFGGVALLAAQAPDRYPALLDLVVILYALRIVNKVAQRKVQVEAFEAPESRVWSDAVLLAAFGLAVLLLK